MRRTSNVTGTCFARLAGPSWRVDKTYVKIRGKWVHLYRVVDGTGNTVDFRLSPRRDVAAAKAFFGETMKGQGSAPCINAASHRAVLEKLPADVKLRSSKYLNNLIEQDHRGVKLRIVIASPPILFFRFAYSGSGP